MQDVDVAQRGDEPVPQQTGRDPRPTGTEPQRSDMTTHKIPKASDGPPTPTDAGDDTEGHSLWISPSASREMANSRNRDLERQTRDRQRVKEAQDKKR